MVDPTTIETTYLDVAILPTRGGNLDVATITDAAAEFELAGPGVGSAVLSTSVTPVQMPGTNVFRYFLTGEFAVGDVIVRFLAGSFDSIVGTELIATVVTNITVTNLAEEERFTVKKLIGQLVDRQGRGGGGYDGLLPDGLGQPPESLLLGFHGFRHALEHQVGIGQIADVGGKADTLSQFNLSSSRDIAT